MQFCVNQPNFRMVHKMQIFELNSSLKSLQKKFLKILGNLNENGKMQMKSLASLLTCCR